MFSNVVPTTLEIQETITVMAAIISAHKANNAFAKKQIALTDGSYKGAEFALNEMIDLRSFDKTKALKARMLRVKLAFMAEVKINISEYAKDPLAYAMKWRNKMLNSFNVHHYNINVINQLRNPNKQNGPYESLMTTDQCHWFVIKIIASMQGVNQRIYERHSFEKQKGLTDFSQAQQGDIVVYFDPNGQMAHSGIFMGFANETPIVISKFGPDNDEIYTHPVDHVFDHYGTAYVYPVSSLKLKPYEGTKKLGDDGFYQALANILIKKFETFHSPKLDTDTYILKSKVALPFGTRDYSSNGFFKLEDDQVMPIYDITKSQKRSHIAGMG